ncbi:MAG: protease pro-enzyme activation domain-containing protein [Solirubrobacteraceae bacterium]
MRRVSGSITVALCAVAVLTAGAGSAAAKSTKVDFGDISHKGLKNLGPASTGLKLSLEVGMIANQQGIANAVKAASNPSSSGYGKYLSLSTLQKKYGASSSRRNAVVGAFKSYGVKATVDVTHLRVSATVSINNAQKLFGTKWDLYATGQKNQGVALPVNTPKLVKGLGGNIDTVSGLRLNVTTHHAIAALPAPRRPQATEAAVAGGTPTRTGTISPGCATTTYPAAVFSTAGLFPNQTLTAYGIAPLQAAGLLGQGVRVAVLGEAPTPPSDVTAFRTCFGFAGTALKIHGASNIAPILESSLDAMTIAMAAPKLARLDLWVKALGQADPQGALELLADPLQATTNGTPLPNVISISYGVCEARRQAIHRGAHAL